MCIINSYRMSGVNNSDVDDDDDGRSHDDDDEVNARNATTLEESKKKDQDLLENQIEPHKRISPMTDNIRISIVSIFSFLFFLSIYLFFLGGGIIHLKI